MKIVYPICCGMDIHKRIIVATIAATSPEGVTSYEQRTFSTFNSDLASRCDLVKGRYPGTDALNPLTYIDGKTAKVLTERIRENAERLGLSLRIEVQDALLPVPEDRERYDAVMADVPCSGLGVMGRKNDIKYHVTPEGIRELALQGREILDVAAGYVRPGGRLLFSTCTILNEEDRETAEAFLKKHPEFTKRKERLFLQGIDPCDGFYYCIMEKHA